MARRGLIVRRLAALAVLLSAVLMLAGPGAVAAGRAADGLVCVEGERLMLNGQPFLMKGYNYFPRDYGWTSMADWDWDAVDTELALAVEYGANTIRTGFEYQFLTGDIGGGHPFTQYEALPEYLDAIDRLLSIADTHGLKVVFWLGAGPAWGDLWDPANYGTVEKHLESLIPRFAGDPRIAAWDLATDLDGTMLQLPPLGGYGSDPRSTQENMVTLLENMAGTVHRLDPGHLLTVGFCWVSSCLLVQDFTDFLMPQFLGGDAPDVLTSDGAVTTEYYGTWDWYVADPEGAVDRLAGVITALQDRLREPMPTVLAEFGSPTRGTGCSETYQLAVYEAVLETAFLRLELAGALNWALTDFTWPPKAFTCWEGTLPEEEQSFGILDADYQPKPSAEVARAYYADRPEIVLGTAPAELAFTFEQSFVPAESDPASGDRRELSVAFDWIEFRDAAGKALLRVDVGTPDARPFLGEGFYEDEGPWANDADDFAWAGGADRVARVEVEFPEGTASVAFRAVADLRQQIDISVDGRSVATVHSVPGWTLYAVDLPAEEPASVGISRTFGGTLSLPVSAGTVILEMSYDGVTWEAAATVAPERGRFAATVTFRHGGPALVRAAWSGAGLYGSAVGDPVEVVVAAAPLSLVIAGPAESATAGRETLLTGRVEPAAAAAGGREISVALIDPEGTQTASSVGVGADGRFEIPVIPDRAGTWSASVSWAGDADYLACEAECNFVVVEEAGGNRSGVPVAVAVAVPAVIGCGFLVWVLRRWKKASS